MGIFSPAQQKKYSTIKGMALVLHDINHEHEQGFGVRMLLRKRTVMKKSGKRTGKCFVREGLIKKKDIDAVLRLQKKNRKSMGMGHEKLFGTLLCDLSLLDPITNYYFLHKYNKLFQLDHFLSFRAILTPQMLRIAETRSKDTATPLLSMLLGLGMVTKIGLRRLVSELYHVPFMFISPQAFENFEIQDLPFQFSREKALEKMMLPLVINNKTVTIGITDPANLLCVYELIKKFPRLKFEPVFILYSCFHRFFHLLYEQDSKGPEPDLSQLLKSKITLSDPRTEQVSIACLYSRYELLKGINRHGRQGEKLGAFKKFIFQEHQRIARRHGCSSIDYSFRKQKNQVNLIAVPKN